MVKIQSFSDIITNSSSELFVVKGTEEAKKELEQVIKDLYNSLGRDMNEDLEFEIANDNCYITHREVYFDREYELNDYGYDYTYDKGDLLISSMEENSIPYPIMEFIEYYKCLNPDIETIERWHLG